MRRLFGTDGIRGIANEYPMTAEMAMQIGRAIAVLCKHGNHRHKIIIGKDTRISGYMFETSLSSGICSMGVDIMLVGPLPTPAIAFITQSMRADAGIVISASHNPYQDNGIKIFSRDGFKLPDEIEEKIEELVFAASMDSLRPSPDSIGKAFRIDDASGRYIQHLKNTFPAEMTLDGFKIVVDCANGAAYKVAPIVFSELGADVISTGVEPDGININKDVGALYPEHVSELVKKHKADIGIALDGDGDRVIICDEKGRVVDGDQIMAINAVDMAKSGRLKKNIVVATVMSNMGLEIFLKDNGIRLARTQVGDRYVVEYMRGNGLNFGGEQSGHIIFMDHLTTGDGILAALQTLSVMKKKERPLSELANVMKKFPQVLINFKVKEKKDLSSIGEVSRAIKQAEKSLKGKGRILVRYSGTEMKLRVMVEGESKEKIEKIANNVSEIIKKYVC
ncbi:MAG: phosphoglucosamine mutase [Deltaproteobacteria bacterium]|nr:phosphoglucosamine mutase [Deltaproteobacteria bacterium]